MIEDTEAAKYAAIGEVPPTSTPTPAPTPPGFEPELGEGPLPSLEPKVEPELGEGPPLPEPRPEPPMEVEPEPEPSVPEDIGEAPAPEEIAMAQEEFRQQQEEREEPIVAPTEESKVPATAPIPVEIPPGEALPSPSPVFTPPVGAIPGPAVASGEPEYYTLGDERYYTPASTMWKIGYETKSEFIEGQAGRRVQVEPGKVRWEYGPKYVAVKTDEGFKHITREQAQLISQVTGEAQFLAMKGYGLLPVSARYVQKDDGSWGYTTQPTTVEPIFGMQVEGGPVASYGLTYLIFDRNRDTFVEVTSEQYLERIDFYRRASELAQEAKGLVRQAQIDAQSVLADYRTDEGYNIIAALSEARFYDRPDIVNAVKTLFSSDTVREAEEFVDEHYYPEHWEEGSVPRKLSELWRKVTPWKEELGETVLTALSEPSPYEDIEIGTPTPLPEPVRQKAEEVAKWFGETWLPQVQQITEQFTGQIRGTKLPPPELDWFAPGVEVESPIPSWVADTPAGKLARVVPETAFMMGVTIPGTILGHLGQSFSYAVAQQPEQADLVMASLVSGVAEWFVGRPKAFVSDPYYEIPHTALLLIGPAKLGRAAKAAKARVNPREISNTAVALQADVARVTRPEGMEFVSARRLVEEVELTWAGKAPEWIRDLDPLSQAVLTAAVKHKDVVFRNESGQVIGRASPFQRTTSQTAFHATQNVKDFVVGKEGYIEVQATGKYSGMFTSPQLSQSFMAAEAGRPAIAPGGVAIRFSAKDFKPLPQSVAMLRDANAMRVELTKLAESGQLEPGVYPLFKEYGSPPKLELETFVAPGTKLYPVEATWYAPGRNYNTASSMTSSMISAEGIRAGQSVPLLWLATEAAKREGLGVPSMKQMYLAELLDIATTPLKWLPWRRTPRRLAEKGEAAVSSPYAYQVVTLKASKLPQRHSWEGKLKEDVFDPNTGNLLESAQQGAIRRRVTAVVVDNQGRILLGSDKVEPKGFFDLPGGRIDPQGKFGKTQGQPGISIEGAAHGQIKSEFGLGLQNTVRLPIYTGMINRHSLPGSYVVLASPITTAINRYKYTPKGRPPELKDAIWWEGKTPIYTSLAARDILQGLHDAGVVKIDMSLVKIHEGAPKVVRDVEWSNRLKYLDVAEVRVRIEEAVRDADRIALERAKKGENYEQVLREELNVVKMRYEEEFLPYHPRPEPKTVGIDVIEPEILVDRKVVSEAEAVLEISEPKIGELILERAVVEEPVEPVIKEPEARVLEEPVEEPITEEPLEAPIEEPVEEPTEEPVTEEPPEPPIEEPPEPPIEEPPEPPIEEPPEPPIEEPPEPPTEEPPEPPIEPPTEPPIVGLDTKAPEVVLVTIPMGSIAWRQGKPFGKEQIKYIPPPYTQLKPISLLDRKPVGWVDKGRTPAETLQIIGQAASVPKRISIDLGIADITIVDGRQIEFTGGGLTTDFGPRMPSTTKGMGVSPAELRREEVLERRALKPRRKPATKPPADKEDLSQQLLVIKGKEIV